MRVRSFPFSEDVERFLAAHQLLFVVEQNATRSSRAADARDRRGKSKLRSLLHYNGLPISSAFIVEGVLANCNRASSCNRKGRCVVSLATL